MEDEKQVVRDLLTKRPFSIQTLHDARAAFNDLSRKDRHALISEVLSSLPPGHLDKWKGLFKNLQDTFRKIAPQLETLANIDQQKAIYHLAIGLPAELAREKKAVNDAAHHKVFDAAVAAEAKTLDISLAVSQKFADAVRPGLKKQNLKAGREKILNSVRRLKSASRKRRKNTGS